MTADYWRVCQALNAFLNALFYGTRCEGDHTLNDHAELGEPRWIPMCRSRGSEPREVSRFAPIRRRRRKLKWTLAGHCRAPYFSTHDPHRHHRRRLPRHMLDAARGRLCGPSFVRTAGVPHTLGGDRPRPSVGHAEALRRYPSDVDWGRERDNAPRCDDTGWTAGMRKKRSIPMTWPMGQST